MVSCERIWEPQLTVAEWDNDRQSETFGQPAHVGLVLNRMALHSRGENGSVRMDSLLVIQRAFTKVEFFSYGVD